MAKRKAPKRVQIVMQHDVFIEILDAVRLMEAKKFLFRNTLSWNYLQTFK